MSQDTDVPQDIDRPWDPQPGETPKAFLAFTAYRDMDPDERAMLKAYRKATGKPEARQTSGTWTAWSSKWRWTERARAWDKHRDREAAGALAVQMADDHREWARGTLAVSRLMRAKAIEILRSAAGGTLSDAVRLVAESHRMAAEALPDAMPHLERDPSGEEVDLLEQLREQLSGQALAGDLKATDLLIRLEERIAKAQGTDAPDRVELGVESLIERLSDGVALAGLTPAARRIVIAELDAGDEEVEGEDG